MERIRKTEEEEDREGEDMEGGQEGFGKEDSWRMPG